MDCHKAEKLPAVAACILCMFYKGARETPSTLSTFEYKAVELMLG